MIQGRLNVVVLGLSITSSWGNGHATTYRALLNALARRGHRIQFFERDMPWYGGAHRDLPDPPYADTRLYQSLKELRVIARESVRSADLVIVGSYVPEGVEVATWVLDVARGVTAFYDIDTPVTLSKLESGDGQYLSADLVPTFDLYLSFSGGPILEVLGKDYGARRPRPLYCSVDSSQCNPLAASPEWALGYLGTYSEDRQPVLKTLLLDAAPKLPEQSFVVAGAQYPNEAAWPANVRYIPHLPPDRHRLFYGAQRFTLNVTRREMVRAGWSPSVRFFEAAGCGTPIISDIWPGIASFFRPGEEILLAESTQDTLTYLTELSDGAIRRIAEAARERVLAEHTADRRAQQLEGYVSEVFSASRPMVPQGRQAAV